MNNAFVIQNMKSSSPFGFGIFDKRNLAELPTKPIGGGILTKEAMQAIWRGMWQSWRRPIIESTNVGYAPCDFGYEAWMCRRKIHITQTGRERKIHDVQYVEVTLTAFRTNISGLYAAYFGHVSEGGNVFLPLLGGEDRRDACLGALFDLFVIHRETGVAFLDREMLSSFAPSSYAKALAERERSLLAEQTATCRESEAALLGDGSGGSSVRRVKCRL